MLELIVILSLSALSAGIFLGAKWNTMLPAAGAGLLLGSAGFFLGLPLWCCFALGVLCAAVFWAVGEKRTVLDGFLAVCIGGCHYGLWATFHSGLEAVADGAIVLFLYSLFYLLHVPAVLLTVDRLRLTKDWHLSAKGRQSLWVWTVALGTLLAVIGAAWLPRDGIFHGVIKILVGTAVFWLGLGVAVLLVICDQKGEQTQAESQYRSQMNSFMNVVRSQRHDYNLHVQTVASLIAQEKWEECRGYVACLVQDTNQMNDVLPVKDPAVGSLIHNYRLLAQQSGHVLLLDIRDDLSGVVTGAYETNKIIGNLLQNALDELSGQEGTGWMELSIFKRGGNCLIRVSNPTRDPEEFDRYKEAMFRQGFSTKHGHDGVGLSSIRALAQQHGGDVTAWREGNTVHFVASIPMQLL